MAYVPGFRNDVVISYGHIDNQAPTRDWVRNFHAYVQGKLNTICSTDVVVWRDPRLQGTDVLRDAVRGEVAHAAIFISVLSAGFAQHAWCAQEVAWFIEASRADALTVEGKSRIVRAVKTPLVDVPWPEGLGNDTVQCRFYEVDDQSQIVHEYSSTQGDPSYPKFDEECNAMTQAIAGLLRKLRAKALQRDTMPARRAIFLALGTRDVRDYRDSVVKELEHREFEVVQPEGDSNASADAITASVQGQAARCDAGVHIVGRFYGTVPEGSAESVVEMQLRVMREAAAARPAEHPLKIVVWQPDGLVDIEQRQQEFLQRLAAQRGEAGRAPFDFLTGTVSQFKDALLDIVAPKAAPDPVPAPQATRGVFLLCHRGDLADRELHCIRTWLFDNGFPNDLPAFQGDATELQRDEEQNIIEADATLIYYGSAEDLWVKQKRQTIQKAWARLPGPAPRRLRAVYLARPEDDLKQAEYQKVPNGMLRERDTFPALVVLGDCGAFDPSKLQPLVSFIREDPRGGRP